MYVVPCYNESEEELRCSLNSLVEQRVVKGDKRLIVIICDGKVKGSGNVLTTDLVLKKILNIANDLETSYDYTTWNGTKNTVYQYKCEYEYNNETVPIILIVKENNYGKRDSLVFIRRTCYLYNNIDNCIVDDIIISEIGSIFNNNKIDYIIGIDADTIFDYNCTYELIQGIDKDEQIHGCVGYVDIYPQMNFASPFVIYQYAEYMFAQCLRRQAQSNITNKVSCLSGCNQILRISEETCGEKILSIFNYCPKEGDNILMHIRSYASEDRNHVCNMLSLYPHVKTTQTLKAISYTIVPTSISVFLSQRRRWNLGANTNDMLLVYLPGINIFERILAAVNILTFSLTPFVFIATIYFLISIITNATLLMLYLAIILIITIFYALLIPIFIRPLSFKDTMYYYLSYIFFISFSGIVGLITFTYAMLHMDIIKWGKTRLIDANAIDANAIDANIKDEIINSKDANVKDAIIELNEENTFYFVNKKYSQCIEEIYI
jgi:chitin synthase